MIKVYHGTTSVIKHPNNQIAILNQNIINKHLAWIEAETLKTDEK